MAGKKETNVVHMHTIWAEQIEKERVHRLRCADTADHFSANPAGLRRHMVTEPVSSRPKRFLDKDHILLEAINRRLTGSVAGSTFTSPTSKLPEALDRSLKGVHLVPKDKFPFPQTEAQEIGWLGGPLTEASKDPRFQYHKKSCDMTKYADTIIASSCVDPFKKGKA
eukprot:EG_transcript_25920